MSFPVPNPPSRYRTADASDSTPDYRHRFHAGNVGDVWKHCALIEVLRRVDAPVTYLESHAGDGDYPLAPTGEWTEGVGRLRDDDALAAGDDAVGRYVTVCRRLGGARSYPGSPRIARALLGDGARLRLWEHDSDAATRLAAAVPGADVTQADGLAALPDAVARAAGAVVVLVDPPYTQKADWTVVPDAFAAAVRASRHASLLLWYPVKSLTRPNAMIARLAAAGVAGTLAELITTPLEHQRRRLNGSGMLLVRPPDGVREALAAAAPVLGARCAVFSGAWSFRMQSWAAA
jgi:23S rRNA (adenine2030-N6)-methyltransferase